MDSLVLLSGGLDSTTALALAAGESDQVVTLSFNYGQRHQVELLKAKEVSDWFGVDEHIVLNVPLPKGDSVLMHEDAEMPKMTYEEIEKSEGVSPTYVPYRNGTFLSLAAAYALDRGCDTIWAGMHAEDARGWAYPDCTPEFSGAMQNAIYVGTYHAVRLVVPFQYATKADIVAKGIWANAPYHLTLSCYEGREPACGECPTCIGRLEAFKINGLDDPIPYAIHRQATI
jgi:7-cyano-7-deazaguanine synthase